MCRGTNPVQIVCWYYGVKRRNERQIAQCCNTRCLGHESPVRSRYRNLHLPPELQDFPEIAYQRWP